jgi:hypothetical protein
MSKVSRAVTLTAIGAMAAGVAVPALSEAGTPSRAAARDITVHYRVKHLHFVHSKPGVKGDRLAPGDRLVIRAATFDEANKASGTLYIACTNVARGARVFNATLECQATYRFGDGDVVAEGVLRPGRAGEHLAIVGGTGAYDSASGEVETAPPAGHYDVDLLHLSS